MKTNRRYLGVVLCALLVSAALISEADAGGSTYARFGVGDLLRYGGSRVDGMGGAGFALTGDGFLNLLNPAGIGKITNTRIAGGFDYTNYNSTDALGSGRFARGNFTGVSFGIPIDKDYGIAMLFEASPYSIVNYATEVKDSVVQQDFYGTGGLSVISLGASVSPAAKLSLGMKLNYVHGQIGEARKFTFLDPTFTNSTIQRSNFYSGFNFTIGGIYEGIGNLVGSTTLDPLSIGFILSTPTSLSVNVESILTTSESIDTTSTNVGNVDIPLAYGVGLSYVIANRYTVTGDIYHQQWQDAKFFGDHSLRLDIANQAPPDIRNSTRLAVGFEAAGLHETSSSYFQRIAYRAGFYYNSTMYVFNGTGINEYFVTGGVGLPIGPDARLDINLHLGTRGTASNGLQRDTILRLTVSVSASEAWFMKLEDE
jgi:hypothetical protein